MNNVGEKVIISMSGLTVCADIIGVEPLTVRVGKSSRIVIGANERVQIINVNTGRTYGNPKISDSGGQGKHSRKQSGTQGRSSRGRSSSKYYRVNP